MNKKQRGITLIEMMIAMLLGLVVTSSIIAIFISNVKSSSENIRMIRLNQELRGTMTFISDEIKRAGYSGAPPCSDFMDDFNFDAGSSCLRYSYDENGDGVRQAEERFGFQLTANAIQWTNRVTSDTCAGTNWQDITDTNIVSITVFTAPESSIPVGTTINVNQLLVKLTGQIVLNPGIASRTIIETIRVRNEDAS